jgi:hypothetical protein
MNLNHTIYKKIPLDTTTYMKFRNPSITISITPCPQNDPKNSRLQDTINLIITTFFVGDFW